MLVDSTALAEQVVDDVIASAFHSAGQRCSALRVLCLQEEVADDVLTMLGGAMQTLAIGDPSDPATDVGPVIDSTAVNALETHVAAFESERAPHSRLRRCRRSVGMATSSRPALSKSTLSDSSPRSSSVPCSTWCATRARNWAI